MRRIYFARKIAIRLVYCLCSYERRISVREFNVKVYRSV
jgi:hypothetical protein